MSTSALSVTASGRTGETCQASGPYRSDRNPSVIVYFKRGDKFPVDPVDGRNTTWKMIEE